MPMTDSQLDKTLLARFDEFWAVYPRKVAKHAALLVWQRLKPDAELTAVIVVAVERQKVLWDTPRFIPHPRTWLLQRRWNDELPGAVSLTPAEAREFEEHFRRMLGQYCKHDPPCEDRQDCKQRQREAWLHARRGR